MIETKPPQALTLFELIGREWVLEQPVTALAFNAKGSALACVQADGALALLAVADAEHPEQRIRMELETGRSTIRPREKPLPPPVVTQPLRAEAGLCAWDDQGFAVAGPEETLWRVTARGQCLPLEKQGVAPVSALCALRGGGVAVARGGELSLATPDGLAPRLRCGLPGTVERLAVSPDGRRLAAWGDGRVTMLRTETLEAEMTLEAPGEAACLDWSPDGRWLAAGCTDRALTLVDLDAGATDRIADFPASVGALGFSRKAGALVAAGAFRVVAWKTPDLPFGDHPGTPLDTGRPGVTLVDCVAPHPSRDLCAAGYANGLVVLSPLGQRDELMLIEGRGAAVTALAWSPDGMHLAAGFADGRAAIATFPKIMFK
ncbi:WD40 repeat domain-containing protein [Salipiger abyssi]|uniref:High-affnity carbon uptake protein Hat/HatR n=1 Tax=Salipiger abyssi TaxID=1250539 RepID=A0A1P8UW49_9RHOB|nr:hypothetical protein [Salipiger abyssi]APZ53627.1 High-affnity carbon uptake protein Hat/HatR [Salipiger abyssi]